MQIYKYINMFARNSIIEKSDSEKSISESDQFNIKMKKIKIDL